MTDRLDTPPPAKLPERASGKRPHDDHMPSYTPGTVPPPEGEGPHSPPEGTAPPDTYPPKRTP